MTKHAYTIHPSLPVRMIKEKIRDATWTAIAERLNADEIATGAGCKWTASSCSHAANVYLDSLNGVHCSAVPIEDHETVVEELTGELVTMSTRLKHALADMDAARRKLVASRIELERLRAEMLARGL